MAISLYVEFVMKKVIGLGAGGHGKVVIDILRLNGDYELAGLLDSEERLWGTQVAGVPVLGGDSVLSELYKEGIRDVFIGVGSIGDSRPRITLFRSALDHDFEVVNAVHPEAVVSTSVEIGRGVTIMAGAIINASTTLGDNVIINTGAIVEHDCVIGNHVHVATGAKLGGEVVVDEGSHIGLGANVRQGVRIGAHSIVGTGAVVVSDIPANVVVTGVPAKILQVVDK